MAQLIVKQGRNLGSTLRLEGDSVSIGREKTNSVYLRDDAISRSHAHLEFEKGVWTVVDLGSSNGTSLNGKRIKREQLHHMDEIQLGDVVLIFMEDTPGMIRN